LNLIRNKIRNDSTNILMKLKSKNINFFERFKKVKIDNRIKLDKLKSDKNK
jgi:hypothetical protein